MSYELIKNNKHHLSLLSQSFPNLHAWTVGFDREWNLLNQIQSLHSLSPSTYPPYNIELLSEDKFLIEMAVAGFSKQ